MKNQNYRLVFCKDFGASKYRKFSKSIFISPSSNWNNFGFKTSYLISVSNDEGKTVYTNGILGGFLPTDEQVKERRFYTEGKQSVDLLSENDAIRESLSETVQESTDLPLFFTIFNSISDYRDLVSCLGKEDATSVLTAINDIALINHGSAQPNWFKKVRNTALLHQGILRNSETFFAFHNAAPIVFGKEHESFGMISQHLQIDFGSKSNNNRYKVKFDFDFSSILPRRINILIGKNGLGKSLTLREIAKALIKNNGNLISTKDSNLNLDFANQTYEYNRPSINRLLVICTPGETEKTFPKETQNSQIPYKVTKLSRRSKNKTFGQLCASLARNDEAVADKSRWNIFLETLDSTNELSNIYLELKTPITVNYDNSVFLNGKRYIKIHDIYHPFHEKASLEILQGIDGTKEPVTIINDRAFPLSSGQLSFIYFLLQACSFTDNGTLILIDEPETHLHPNLITSFVDILDKLLKLTGSIAIIATHSAYFVRETPREQVIIYRQIDDNATEITSPRLKTFGADIDSISHFIFEDRTSSGLINSLARALLESPKDIELSIKELESELSPNAMMNLTKLLNKSDEKNNTSRG